MLLESDLGIVSLNEKAHQITELIKEEYIE